jgi:fatty-acyl-CoA synthase
MLEGKSLRSTPLTLQALLDTRSMQCPDSVAFRCNDVDVTYRDFATLCQRTAGWLEAIGVRDGDRVAVWLPNSVEWLALLFAISQLRATLVSVNTRFRSAEIGALLWRSGAKLLVMQERLRSIDFGEILGAVEESSLAVLAKVAVLGEWSSAMEERLKIPIVPFAPAEPMRSPPLHDPEAIIILFTTSGTTRGPKLVMHAQRTLVGHAHDVAAAYGLGESGAALLAALPFCGVFGLNAALAAFAAGAPITILGTFDADEAARAMVSHGITHVFGSDEMFQKLIDAAPTDPPYPAARLFGFGAFTSSFSDYAQDACRRGLPMVGLYGSSEVLALFSAQSFSLPMEERLRGGGIPAAPSARVRICNPETGECVPDGERGEIEISAPSQFIGYMNDELATREAMREDGFFRTGDLGYLRGDGSFVFEARMGDAMRLGGFLVDPVEIEAVLKRIEGVADAQVVSAPVQRQLRPVAFVVPLPGCILEEVDLIREIATKIARFKVPARIWFVESFPMTESSNGLKTQRGKLRDMAHAYLHHEAEHIL